MILRTNKDNPNLICFSCEKKIEIGEHYLESEYEEGYEIHVRASPLFQGSCE